MTMDLLDKGLSRNRSLIASVNAGTMRTKGGLFDIGPSAGVSQLENFREASADRARYALFKGWIYSAINAIASEAAGQPTQVARLTGSKGKDEPSKTKSLETYRRKMASTIRQKASKQEFELLLEHPLVDLMEQPNPIQTRWSFTYCFVANLNLTGWGYIVGGETEEGKMEFYALPTSWVRPDHTDGPFSKFRIVNPKNPTADMNQEPLTRANVGFAYLPNPADPLSAYAPAASQMSSIRIDDHIQSCQEVFFQNGVFPSVIVTIGKDPHPDAPGGGLRPRLSGAQRRQVTGAIRKVMSGVANYGNPAIVDGLIENIERLSATQNEIGWDKSEGTVRTRILSALGVHPYILGEPVGVGGYAQVANIEKRFYKRVNTYLDMLSSVMTNFVAPKVAKTKTFRKANGTKVARTERLLLWWEQCEVSDPPMRWSNLNAARTRGDVSRNEIRIELGLPPDETGGDRTKTFTASDVTAIVAVQNAVAQGALTVEQAKVLYTTAFDLSEEDAVALAGKQPPKPAPEAVLGAPPAKKPPTEEEVVEEATKALKDAVSALGFTASDMLTKEVASEIFEAAKFAPNQPRVPAGSPHGGEFAGGQHGGSSGGSSSGSDDIDDLVDPVVVSKPETKPKPAERKPAFSASISAEEKTAIATYTKGSYLELNRNLRKCPDTLGCLDKKQKALFKQVDSALSKRDNFNPPKQLYRGTSLPPDAAKALIAKFENHGGKGIAFTGVVSLTEDRKIASNFTDAKGEHGILFKVTAKTGAPVSHLSGYSHEKEVLHPHNTKYKVKGIKTSGNTTTIELEE